MKVFPTETEIEDMAKLLIETYGVTPQRLGKLFGVK